MKIAVVLSKYLNAYLTPNLLIMTVISNLLIVQGEIEMTLICELCKLYILESRDGLNTDRYECSHCHS